METKRRLFEMCKGGEHSTCEGIFEVPGARARTPDNPRGMLRHECTCECHPTACTCEGCGAQSVVKPGTQCASCGDGTMSATAPQA
jgi:hypothetical protein